MRNLDNLDMQLAIEVLSDQARMAFRGTWKQEAEHYYLTVASLGYARLIHFTRAERDLIIAHLAVLGVF